MSEKKPRLWVYGDVATDEIELHCGGPGIDEATQGLANSLRQVVEDLLSGEIKGNVWVKLSVRRLTDEEINELPEVY